jgi:hypothetical protein
VFDEGVLRGGAVLSRWFRDGDSDAVGVAISAVAEGGKYTYAVQNVEPARQLHRSFIVYNSIVREEGQVRKATQLSQYLPAS